MRAAETLEFSDKKAKDENSAILGVLEGPCADFIDPTRNNRKYDESLWEKVFEDEIVNEMFENGGIPGELDHPTDREETDSTKIAILLAEKPKKKNGKLWAKFNILNTPCGKIAYTLARAGFKLGVSSRGSGDTYDDVDGTEKVDENTYDFRAFDLVLLPAVKSARLNLVTESLNKNCKINYKKELREALDTSTEEDKTVMLDTLTNLGINISESAESDDIIVSTEADNIYSKTSKTDDEASDTGSEIVQKFESLITENSDLKSQILELQEKLSVCYTKEAEYAEILKKDKRVIRGMTESVKSVEPLKNRISLMQRKLDESARILGEKNSQIESLNSKIQRMTLTESKLRNNISTNSKDNKSITEQLESMQEQNRKLKASSKIEHDKLVEELESVKSDLTLKTTTYQNKLSEANKLVEKANSIAKKAVDKYISSKALYLGVDTVEITSRLGKSYTFTDIDSVCESLSDYKINISNLPINVSKSTNTVKMKLSESASKPVCSDDSVDEVLLSLANRY